MGWFGWLRRRRGATAVARREDEDYIFGASGREINRLDLQHYMFRVEFGGDVSAPVRSPAAILDVACGTGRWAREMARRFPQAVVIGFDLNREQIDRAVEDGLKLGDEAVPENCTFVEGNALQPFNFADQSFDLVMARANSAFVPAGQWPDVLREMHRVTRAGGWLEVRDFGLVRSESAALQRMADTFAQLAGMRGIYPGVGPYLPALVQALPLREVAVKQVTVRAGPSATRGGRLLLTDYLALMERVGGGVTATGLASADEWAALLAQARRETPTCRTEVDLTAAYGRVVRG